MHPCAGVEREGGGLGLLAGPSEPSLSERRSFCLDRRSAMTDSDEDGGDEDKKDEKGASAADLLDKPPEPIDEPAAGRYMLYVTVLEGRQLAAMDPDGSSDPYVVCTLEVTGETKETTHMTKDLNPIFMEDLTFEFAVDDPLVRPPPPPQAARTHTTGVRAQTDDSTWTHSTCTGTGSRLQHTADRHRADRTHTHAHTHTYTQHSIRYSHTAAHIHTHIHNNNNNNTPSLASRCRNLPSCQADAAPTTGAVHGLVQDRRHGLRRVQGAPPRLEEAPCSPSAL